MDKFDYLVIGGGSTGAIVAARLAERGGVRVALFEAGPSDESNTAVLQLRNWPQLLETELDFDYRIEANPRANGRIRYARGKVLGGCSSHNSCIAFVPPDQDMDAWAASGAVGWSAQDTQAAFKRVRGKVSFETAPPTNELGAAFVDAAIEAGFPLQHFNEEPLRAGVGWFQLNKRGDTRESSSVAYLHPLSQWGDRLTIFTDTFVHKILLESGQAVGIETQADKFHCERDVIVCCGAIDSPKLLMLSGIGPADHLKELGIPVEHDLAGVGQNLQDHPEGVINWEASQPVPEITTQLYEIGLFARIEAKEALPDLMAHFGTEMFDMNTSLYGYPTAKNAFCFTPNVTRPHSRGFVKLRSDDPAAPPIIDLRYFTDAEGHDERILIEGIKIARRIVQQPPLKSWVKRELTPGENIQIDADISTYVRKTANTVYHPTGTCKMGTDRMAVVDPLLRVHGISGLRVADASVFPRITTVNPNITCMMVGERCADFVLNHSDEE